MMPRKIKYLREHNFASKLGIQASEIPMLCSDLIHSFEFSYYSPTKRERDLIILDVLKRIGSDTQRIATPGRREVWENGWGEVLNEYQQSNHKMPLEELLTPKFIRNGQPIRLNQDYVVPLNDHFELNFVKVIRAWIFSRYFREINVLHEFGCGTGFNLLAFAKLFPDKFCIGSDFVQTSVDLVNLFAKNLSLNVQGKLFDMSDPDNNYVLGDNDAAFTFGSIEQLGGNVGKFLDFLMLKKPSVCVHVEPAAELYDEDNLIDNLALQFQRRRGYTEGLVSKLRALELSGSAVVTTVQRLFFGSLMMEGYNLIVWHPKR